MASPGPDPHGQAALLLCESLIHVLVEGGLVTKQEALGAIATVSDVRDVMVREERAGGEQTASGLLRAIASSIEAIDVPPLN